MKRYSGYDTIWHTHLHSCRFSRISWIPAILTTIFSQHLSNHQPMKSQETGSVDPNTEVRTIGWARRTDFANIRQESDKVGSFLALAEPILNAEASPWAPPGLRVHTTRHTLLMNKKGCWILTSVFLKILFKVRKFLTLEGAGGHGLLWFARSQIDCFLIATPWISQGEVIPSSQAMTEQTSRLGYVITVCLNPFQNDGKTINESCRVLSLSFFWSLCVFFFFLLEGIHRVHLAGKVQFVEGRDVPFLFFWLKAVEGSHRASLSPR